jgi:hypothetical protein
MYQGSEVARLRQQITAECQAMKLGMSGLASGTATHTFITARLHRVDLCCDQLQGHVGEREATRILCELYDEVMK